MNRGFSENKQQKGPVLGEKAYFAFIKGQEAKSEKTENATEWFRRPAYYFGERRKDGLGTDGHIRLHQEAIQNNEQD